MDERLGEIETALEAFEDSPVMYDPTEIGRAGIFVSIGHDGRLSVDRGYVRPEDEATIGSSEQDTGGGDDAGTDTDGAPQRTVITVGGEPQGEDEDDDVVKSLPERLVIELTAHRTLALREAITNNPRIAMTALLHKLVRDTFQHVASSGCLEASVRHVFFPVQPEDLKGSAAARAIAERQDAWKADLPSDDEALWARIDGLDDASRMALLAHCVSFGVNALYEKGRPLRRRTDQPWCATATARG